jgi:hypothetical protein
MRLGHLEVVRIDKVVACPELATSLNQLGERHGRRQMMALLSGKVGWVGFCSFATEDYVN